MAQSSRQPRGLAIFGAAALGLVFLVALGVTLAIASRGDGGPPTALADRVPATVELYIGFDTDLASDRWMHLEQLLDTLGVLERTLEERDDAFAEEGIDFDREVLPVLTEIEHAALVAELVGGADEDPQFAFLIETRDEAALLDLLDRLQFADEPRSEREERHDDDLGLTTVEYYGPRDSSEPQLVIASRDGMVYVGLDADYLASLVRRADDGATLDSVPEFQQLADEAGGDVLVFAFVDTQDAVEAFADELRAQALPLTPLGFAGGALDPFEELSPETPRFFASTLSAQRRGFSWELLVLDEREDDVPAALLARPDLEAAAAATPAEARLFIAAAELGAQIVEQLSVVREDGGAVADLLDDTLGRFRNETGVDLERDLLPLLNGTFAFSLGIRSLRIEEPDFALFLTESDDHAALAGEVDRLRRFFEREVGRDAELVIGEHAGFSFVGWPDRRVERRLDEPATLGESERFRDTLKMLPDDPQWLLYLDLGFVFDELLESGDLPLDESNPDAIRGFGLSWSRDGELIRISVAVPIEAAP